MKIRLLFLTALLCFVGTSCFSQGIAVRALNGTAIGLTSTNETLMGVVTSTNLDSKIAVKAGTNGPTLFAPTFAGGAATSTGGIKSSGTLAQTGPALFTNDIFLIADSSSVPAFSVDAVDGIVQVGPLYQFQPIGGIDADGSSHFDLNTINTDGSGNLSAHSFTADAAGFIGSGSGLTALSASQLTTGTVPLGRLPSAAETNNGAITSGALLKSTGGSGVTAATAGVDYLGTNNVLNGTAMGANQVPTTDSGTNLVPFAAKSEVLTNKWAGSRLEIDVSQTNATDLTVGGGITNWGIMYWKRAASASGKTNIVFYDSTGQAVTNDLTTFIGSLPAGSGSQTPWTGNINGGGFNLSGVATITATAGILDLGATNGANATNLVMINTNGTLQFGIYDPSTFTWNAVTRTLTSTGGATGLANPLTGDLQGATHNIWNVGIFDTTNASPPGTDIRVTSVAGNYGGTNPPVLTILGGTAGQTGKPVVVRSGYFEGTFLGDINQATNLITGATATGTNFTPIFNGIENMTVVTNDGPDIFFNFGTGGFGHAGYLIKPFSGGHVTIHTVPYNIDFYPNATNTLATNASLYFDCWGKTNYGWVVGSILETQ